MRKQMTSSTALVSLGWGVSSFLAFALLWSPASEMALGGGVMGAFTGVAFFRSKLIDDWKHAFAIAALWCASLELSALVQGRYLGFLGVMAAMALAGAGSGLLLRIPVETLRGGRW